MCLNFFPFNFFLNFKNFRETQDVIQHPYVLEFKLKIPIFFKNCQILFKITEN